MTCRIARRALWAAAATLAVFTAADLGGQQRGLDAIVTRSLAQSSLVSSGSNEVRLTEPVKLSSPGAGAARSGGASIVVLYQVGTVSGKRAFINVVAGSDAASSLAAELEAALGRIPPGNGWKLADGSIVDRCVGKRECVRSCPKPGGGEFCCKWQCKGR